MVGVWHVSVSVSVGAVPNTPTTKREHVRIHIQSNAVNIVRESAKSLITLHSLLNIIRVMRLMQPWVVDLLPWVVEMPPPASVFRRGVLM